MNILFFFFLQCLKTVLEKFGLPGKLQAMMMYNLIHILDLQESTCKPNENVSVFFPQGYLLHLISVYT